MEEAKILSVCLITYNHERFIRDAIEGVLMQKVNFSWELIIADDFSTDGTRDIILEYKNKYPDFIHLIFQDKNVGPAKNWLDLITRPRSKYIAYFEGDDYWTDPLKLQKQVDFLESNSDYAIHFMNARTIDNKSSELTSKFLSHTKYEFTIDDFISTSNPICTLTAVFKNSKKLQSDEFNIILDYPYGDWGLWIFILYHSGLKVKYDATVGASYRIHDQGVFSTKKPVETLNKFIKIQELNLIHFPNLPKSKINAALLELKIKLLKEFLYSSKISAIRYYFSNYFLVKRKMPIRDFLYAVRNY